MQINIPKKIKPLDEDTQLIMEILAETVPDTNSKKQLLLDRLEKGKKAQKPKKK